MTQKLSTEGADMLTLAGVNDGNLVELSRLCGVKVALRGDAMSISGPQALVERASDIGRRMVERARQRMDLTPDDVLRLSEDDGSANGDGSPMGDGRIALPGMRKLIQAKTSGQAEYLVKIAENDIVVGLARPAVEAGESLGFLPGDMQAKVDPYLRPLYDALDEMMPQERVQKALETRVIEIAPLAFMRGRTLSDAFVILDEAQNATAMQMKMFLTRLGVNSQIVITGDKTQIDLPKREESGLMQVERILPGIDGIAFHYFTDVDVVRHRLVRDIIKAYAEDGD